MLNDRAGASGRGAHASVVVLVAAALMACTEPAAPVALVAPPRTGFAALAGRLSLEDAADLEWLLASHATVQVPLDAALRRHGVCQDMPAPDGAACLDEAVTSATQALQELDAAIAGGSVPERFRADYGAAAIGARQSLCMMRFERDLGARHVGDPVREGESELDWLERVGGDEWSSGCTGDAVWSAPTIGRAWLRQVVTCPEAMTGPRAAFAACCDFDVARATVAAGMAFGPPLAETGLRCL